MGVKKKILVIDDDLALAKALTIELISAGFAVIGSSNGEDGLIATKINKPNLVVLDILMPQLDGIKMLRKLRTCKDEFCKEVPVIILTNLTNELTLEQASELNCCGYIIKSNVTLKQIALLAEKWASR